jgi:hypothetical protein
VRAKKAFGAADDVSDGDGKMVLSWKQARDAAREWFKTAYYEGTGERTGVCTVAKAVDAYNENRKLEGIATADRMWPNLRAAPQRQLHLCNAWRPGGFFRPGL